MARPGKLVPEVSVIIPLYRSASTLAGCLESLIRQSFADWEAILIDSSPDEECAQVVRPFLQAHPAWRYEHSPRRLWPQEARNRGVALARGSLLVFTDPDVYAGPGWLAHLVAAGRTREQPVVGALASFDGSWFDQGVHLCKFSKWLPAGPPRPVDMAPTANLLCPRRLFEEAGGFRGDMLMADTTLSWELRRRGATLWFEPGAAVAHHHLHSPRSFLSERYRRGRLFGRLRVEWLGGRRGQSATYLAATLTVRLATNLLHCARHARVAGQTGVYLRTLPVISAGFAASLLGEAAAYGRHALGGSLY